MEQNDTRTPTIKLDEEAIMELKKIFQYTKIISDLIKVYNRDSLKLALVNDISLQNALIFCLKAIGVCIDKAAESMELEVDQLPLFWRNLHYLRNNLIHHCPAIFLSGEKLDLLSGICTKIGHVYKYFSLVVDAKNTYVNLGNERYKVFVDVHALTDILAKDYPSNRRHTTSQEVYLRLIFDAIQEIEKLINTKEKITQSTIVELKQKNPKIYFAIQNLLELISTLANPNPQYRLLSQETRQSINKTHENADIWLRSLGESRIEAMHKNITINDKKLSEHINAMLLLKSEVLLNKDFKEKFRIDFNSNVTTDSTSSSTTTITTTTVTARSQNSIQPVTGGITSTSNQTHQTPPQVVPVWGRGQSLASILEGNSSATPGRGIPITPPPTMSSNNTQNILPTPNMQSNNSGVLPLPMNPSTQGRGRGFGKR